MPNFRRFADKLFGRKILEPKISSTKLVPHEEGGVGHIDYYDADGNKIGRSANIRYVSKETAQWVSSLR